MGRPRGRSATKATSGVMICQARSGHRIEASAARIPRAMRRLGPSDAYSSWSQAISRKTCQAITS